MGPRATIAGVKGSAVAARHAVARERAAIVGLQFGRSRRTAVESSLDELADLVDAAGATVVDRAVQERSSPDPAVFIGRGKAERLARTIEETGVDLVVVDHELTPGQLRNLEGILDCRVLDRTQLILDIFAARARTREGKLQVELAQLRYLLPRLAGSGSRLSRLGAGIGTRGPGEMKLETDRRRIRQRIGRLSRDLEIVRRRRGQLRDRRRQRAAPTAALIGYTNAGKSSLFNLLTGGEADSSDALFVTLDPLVRALRLPDRRTVLVSDTVGFVDRLPHTLVAAFRATLEEVTFADLLLHVVDASHEERASRMAAVERVLDEVGAADRPTQLVFNKCDLVDEATLERLRAEHPSAVVTSAATGTGRGDLVGSLTSRLQVEMRRVRLSFDDRRPADRRRISMAYRHGRVLRHVSDDGRAVIDVEAPSHLADRWRRGIWPEQERPS